MEGVPLALLKEHLDWLRAGITTPAGRSAQLAPGWARAAACQASGAGGELRNEGKGGPAGDLYA